MVERLSFLWCVKFSGTLQRHIKMSTYNENVANLETNPSGTQLREKSSLSICPSSLDSFNYDIILENHLGQIWEESDFGIRLNHYWCSLYCHWISP